jgi:hypothetical protein
MMEVSSRNTHTEPTDSLLVYREVARWIAAHRDRPDAQHLLTLVLSLACECLHYAAAYECTDSMETSSAALAVKVLSRYLEEGASPELRQVSAELRLMFPARCALVSHLLAADGNVGRGAHDQCFGTSTRNDRTEVNDWRRRSISCRTPPA